MVLSTFRVDYLTSAQPRNFLTSMAEGSVSYKTLARSVVINLWIKTPKDHQKIRIFTS